MHVDTPVHAVLADTVGGIQACPVNSGEVGSAEIQESRGAFVEGRFLKGVKFFGVFGFCAGDVFVCSSIFRGGFFCDGFF